MSSALDSHAIGTGREIVPCGDKLRPAQPAPPPSGRAIGVTFSGGGFRATLAALGVIRYLADAGLLSDVRYASSVSGGSIANGLLARHWPALRAANFQSEAVDRIVVDPFVQRISRHSLKGALVTSLWRLGKPGTARTDLLARSFDRWFFDGLKLEDLDPEVRWVINAANVETGVRFTFERDVVGDYVVGLAPTAGTGLKVAHAAAASASVPGPFSAWPLPHVDFPCGSSEPKLLDGGVYDNTGLEVLDGERYRDVFTVTMNAGGLLRLGGYGKVPIVRDLARANGLLYRQSTALRTRAMVQAFLAGERRGVLVALATAFGPGNEALAAWRARFAEEGADLAFVPTVFDKLDEDLCRRLVRRGWWLIGAAIAAYHPEMAPDPERLTAP